jgi:hypothetical protein
MAILAISRDWGSEPSIVRITTDNTLAEITTSEYLEQPAIKASIQAINNGDFEWLEGDLAAINYADGEGFFNHDEDNNTFTVEVQPGTLSETLPDGDIFVGNGLNVATGVTPSGDITLTNTGVFGITAGAIVNADVNAAAAIAFSKLAVLASANILVGSAGGVATSVAVTGDVTISNTGVTAIAADSIVNADINSAAAIAFSKLAALPSAQILVGSAGNVATAVAVTGDVTISNAGVTTIGAGAVDLAMLSTGIAPSGVIKFMGQVTSVGGAAAEAFAVAGALAASDRAFVQVVNNGTGNVTVLQAVVTNDTLTVTFSADPQNDTVINYQLIRAAA